MKDINLSLNVNDVNLVLRALGSLPSSQVHGLIDKIQQQAREQLEKGNGVANHAEELNHN